jgi:hypothetical protein
MLPLKARHVVAQLLVFLPQLDVGGTGGTAAGKQDQEKCKMQNAKCRMQNGSSIRILHSAFCILH